MRPVELEVGGFTSFRDRQVIDFSPLGLFVITGPTGSGKTSVLDAMTLALYGLVPRGGKHDVKSLITLGKSDALVRLDFDIGQTRYRVARRFSRKGAHSATLERLEDGEWTPEVDRSGVTVVTKKIEKLIGLDFDAFTRAVLLPQGEFHRFLKGKPEERKGILERLLELGRYKLAGRRAGEVAKAQEGRARVLETHLETTYADATPERLAALEEVFAQALDRAARVEELDRAGEDILGQISAVDSRLERQRSLLADLDRLHKKWIDLHELKAALDPRQSDFGDRLDQASQKLAEARNADEAAKKALKKIIGKTGDAPTLVRLENAAGSLREALLEGERARGEEEQLRQELEQLAADRTRLADETAALSTALTVAKDQYERARRSLQIAREAATQETALRAAVRDSERLRPELDGTRESLVSLSGERERIGSELQHRSTAVANAAEALADASKDLQRATESTRKVELANAKLKELREVESDLALADSQLTEASSAEGAAEEVLAAALHRLRDVEHENLAATLREGLEAGDTCPVCAQPVHELPIPSAGTQGLIQAAKDDVAKAERKRQQARVAVDGARSALATAQERVAGIDAALKALGELPSEPEARGALDAAERAHAQADLLLGEARLAFSDLQLELRRVDTARAERETLAVKLEREFKEASGRASIARGALSAAYPEGISAVLEREEKAFSSVTALLDSTQTSLASSSTGLGKAETSLKDRQSLLVRVKNQLRKLEEQAASAREILSPAFPRGLPADPTSDIRDRRARLIEAEGAAEGAREVFEKLRSAIDELRDEELKLEEDVSRLSTGTAGLVGQLSSLASEAVKVGIKELPAITAGEAKLDELREFLGVLRSQLEDAVEQERRVGNDKLSALESLVREASETVPVQRTAQSMRKVLSRELALAREASVEGKNAVSVLQAKLGTIASAREQIRELRATAERHHRLWVDLKSDNFLDFLLRESFQDLSAAASIELRRVSAGRYSLVSEGSDFLVVDHANADDTRSVVTLSGGETFLASLSLALSLAGAIQDLAGTAAASRLDAIFIDEGFGALDPSALDTVIDALERLQEGDRMVGVITHVKELADRIPSGLEIQPGTAGGGSRVLQRA